MKIKNFLLILLVISLWPIKSYALTGDVILNCDKTSVKYNDEINCKVTGNNFSEDISSFHGEILLGSNLTLLSVTEDQSWEGSGDKGIIDLYTDVNKNGKINFVEFKVKVNKDNDVNSKISISNIIVGDSKFKESKLDNTTIDIKVNSSNSSNSNPDDNNITENPGTGSLMKSTILLMLTVMILMVSLIYKKKIKL